MQKLQVFHFTAEWGLHTLPLMIRDRDSLFHFGCVAAVLTFWMGCTWNLWCCEARAKETAQPLLEGKANWSESDRILVSNRPNTALAPASKAGAGILTVTPTLIPIPPSDPTLTQLDHCAFTEAASKPQVWKNMAHVHPPSVGLIV
jgi:hypothetical protein